MSAPREYLPDHHALVAGFERYPELGRAAGSEEDASAFHEWVTSKSGGRVDPARAPLILTSRHHGRNISAGDAFDAAPAVEQLGREIARLHERACSNDVGPNSRLYVYFSCHGRHRAADSSSEWSAATAARDHLVHFAVKYAFEYFRARTCFAEVLLFIDCCRMISRLHPILPLPRVVDALQSGTATRRFHVFARHANTAPSGAFTAMLLDGLRGDAADEKGEITTKSLEKHIYARFDDYIGAGELGDRPSVETDGAPGDGFVIVARAAAPFRQAHFLISPISRGKRVVICDGTLAPICELMLDTPSITLSLRPGIYVAQIQGTGECLFRVPPQGDTYVDL